MGIEGLDQIENFYSQELEKLDQEFLEKISKSKKNNQSMIEKELKQKLLDLRKQYEKKVSTFLKNYKSFEVHRNEDKLKGYESEDKGGLDILKSLNSKKSSFDLEIQRRLNERWALFKFKKIIQFKKIKEKIFPNFLKVFFIRIKFFIKNFRNQFVDKFSNFFLNISKNLSFLLNYTKKFFKSIFSFLEKIMGFLFRIHNVNSIERESKEKN